MGGDTWLVNGAIITVSDGTAGLPASSLDPGLQVGDPVKVTFNVLEDGTWLAERIVSLVEEPQVPEPAPSPTATADPLAMPGYQFTPDEMVVQSCGNSTLNITGVLQNDASQSKDYAANLQIGYLIDRGGEQVSSVELLPDHWQRIEAGQSVPFNVHVVMNDRWSTARPGDEVKLRIFPVSATNRPDHLNGQLTITIRAGCEPPQEPYPPVIQPPAESPIPAEPQKPLDPAAPDGALCTGTDPHPTGLKLAQRYAVTYEEIMKWFCEGRYGFGEIDLAYSLSRQSNKPVEEIFTLRASGLGWGDIKKQVLDGQKLEKDTPYTPESDVNGDGSIDHKDDVDGNGYITGNDKKMWKDQQDKKDPHNKDDHKDKEKDKGKDKGSGHE
jgi:hypothetical protein